MLPLLTEGGGAEKYFIDLARNLSGKGIDIDIITMDENFFWKFGKLLHIFSRGDFFKKIDAGREKEEEVSSNLGKAKWIKTNFKNLRRNLNKYEIIYSKNELTDLILLKTIGYKKLPPVIIGVHTPLFFPQAASFITKLHNLLYLGPFYKWLISGAKFLHVSNKFTENLANKTYNIKSNLIYYPFSVEETRNTAKNQKFPLIFSKNKKNIFFSGRLSEQKGIGALLRIIEKIGENRLLADKICLNIFGVGGEEENDKIKKMCEKHDFVKYFGHVPNKYIPDILSHQEVMITSSKWETLPFNVLEAQAMGIPVISFDIPGPADIIENYVTGVLVDSEEAFIDFLAKIINEELSFKKELIIQNLSNKFDPETIHSKLLIMFKAAQ